MNILEYLHPDETTQRIALDVRLLETRLVEEAEKLHSQRREELELKERTDQLRDDFEKQQKMRFDCLSDFTRQYEATRDELIARINVLDSSISELRDQLELSRIAADETLKEKTQLMAQKDQEIEEHDKKIQQMRTQFDNMLMDTLQRMSAAAAAGAGDISAPPAP